MDILKKNNVILRHGKMGVRKPRGSGNERLAGLSSLQRDGRGGYRPKSEVAGQVENRTGFTQVKLVSRFIGG